MSNIAFVSHGFRERCESHKQDGETLSARHICCQACQRLAILPWPSTFSDMNGQRPIPWTGGFAAGAAGTSPAPPQNARNVARKHTLTADTQPFDQSFVSRLVGAIEIVENLTPLRNELEQPAPRVVVLDVSLEVLGQAVNPLGEQRNLYFGRTRIAGLGTVILDKLRLARGRYRHRHQPFCLPARPTMPDKLNTRLGTISPRSNSAMAMIS